MLAVTAFFLMVGAAAAQDYPVRPIKRVAFYPPGGSSDFVARMNAQKISATSKETRVVENPLNQELNHLLALPDVRAALEKQGASPDGGTPQDLTAFTEAEIRKWGKVIRDDNIKPDSGG